MRVIVTGVGGRAGSHTVRERVSPGHAVINLDALRPPAGLPGDFVQLDLTDVGEAVDVLAQLRPEGVCHPAANPSTFGVPRHQTFENNVRGTNAVMQAAGDVGVRRLVYAGSEMATGWLTADELPPRFPCEETDRARSPNANALSKLLGEVMAADMVRQYPAMSIASLRIDNVTTPDGYDVPRYRREIEGHEVFLIAAADTCLDTPIQDAVERLHGPGASFAPDHGPFDSVFDGRKSGRRLGWRPRFSWRDG